MCASLRMRTSALASALLDLVLAPVCLGCRGALTPEDPARPVCRRCRSLLAPPAPPLCQRCGAPLLLTGRNEGTRCPDCRAWPPSLRFARSACLYQPPADRLVHALKYQGWSLVAAVLARRMTQVVLPDEVNLEARLCIPVPTTRARRRQRGYDQAWLLAGAFAALTGRTAAQALLRMGNSVTQTALQPIARGANVAGGFRVDERFTPSVAGAHVLLVDDVLTTGATAIECARTLVGAGARCVSLITFARALVARSRT